jgi:type II secretory ATPase GspE/PulE/Tfp pilus assembly ATPase PilB-like protein
MHAFVENTADSVIKGKSLEEQLEYQKHLNRIAKRIYSATGTDGILLNLQNDILGLFDADRLTLYTVDGLREEVVSKFKTGNEIKEIAVPIDNESIAGYCAASGKAVNVFDVYDENELTSINPELRFDRTWDQRTGYKTTQILSAPISYNKSILGVIQLLNKKEADRFTQEDQYSILDIANFLQIAFLKYQKIADKNELTKFDFLITNNIISSADLTEAMSRARKTGRPVELVIMSQFHVAKDDVGKSLSDFYRTRFIHYDENMIVPSQLLKGLRISYLKNNVFVPVAQSGDKVIVAMENPNYLPARDAIKKLIPAKEFEYCVSLKEDIYRMIHLFFNVKRTEMVVDESSTQDIHGQREAGKIHDEKGESVTEEDSAVVQLVYKIITDAYKRGASDIHIEPRQRKGDAAIRFRVDGACQVYQDLPKTYTRAVVSRIKIMSDLDIAERRLPQDGKIIFKKFSPLDIELRVATIPTAGQNEDVVMRILTSGEPLPLDKMDLSERNFRVFLELIQKPYGIVLVVGPTGSGKTTTLHAALAHINKPETKIWTAEDPIEITQEGLRQVQVMPKIGLDFSKAMKAFLRADPDVIMVGEMRDHESVSTGIEASLTGHLVFSTLHTNSAPETIVRLLDMGMDPFNFSDALLGVLAQRLVKTLCRHCKEKYHPSRAEFDALVRAYDGDFDALGFEYNDAFLLFRPKGCPECNNSGYLGRTGIHELLVATDGIKSLIQHRSVSEELRAQAAQEGMTTLMQDGIRKVCLGFTDLIQVRKVCMR